MTIPRTTVAELQLLAHSSELTALGPIVEITGYGDSRTLPVGLPLITVGRHSCPDVDLNVADAEQHGQNPEQLIAAVLAHPEASIVIAQLLRTTETLPIPDALVLESLAFSTLQSGREFRSWLHHRGTPNITARPVSEPAARQETVTVTSHHNLTHVQLTRRARANSLDAPTRARLSEVFHTLALTDEAIQLSGAGPHFCAGGDLTEFGTFTSPVTAHLVRTTTDLPAAIAAVSERLKTHVHGACVGAGLELAAFSHRVIADPTTIWKLPEIPMGLIPGSGGTVSVPRRIGRHRTLQLCLSPTGITTHTALEWGLADALSPTRDQGETHP